MAPSAAPIGILPNGTPVWRSFQPSIPSVALLLTPYLPLGVDPTEALPLPSGISLQRSPAGGRQLQLVLAPNFAVKWRRAFGYVGDLQLTDGEGTDTPAQLQVVIKAPWKYGSTSAETENSWTYARVQAFVSKSLFSTPAQVVKGFICRESIFSFSWHIHCLGTCVTGFIEPSSGDSKSAQLVGWDVCSFDHWRAMAGTTVPNNWEFNMDAIFVLPQLSGTNFDYTRLPHVSFYKSYVNSW